ncbi:MAG: RNase adaptor protein RapZ, partial [Candidatus Regiella insecticola]|nr:RNase adaptor protein RapZ [Candidatus Regiella insecticola]
NNNRHYLTVAVGCTGGQHRSVYVTEKLVKHFRYKGKIVQLHHRALWKNNNDKKNS